MTQIDRTRRDASNCSSLVKYGQYMDDIGRNYKIEEVKSDPSGIRSDRKMILKIELVQKHLRKKNALRVPPAVTWLTVYRWLEVSGRPV